MAAKKTSLEEFLHQRNVLRNLKPSVGRRDLERFDTFRTEGE